MFIKWRYQRWFVLKSFLISPLNINNVMIVFYSNSLLDFFMKSVKSYKQQGGALLVMVITGGVAGLLGIGLNYYCPQNRESLILWD